jgi:hypothetical protein
MIHVNRDARLGCGSGGGPDVRGGWVALESVAIAFTVGTFSSCVHGPRRVRMLHPDLSSQAFCSSHINLSSAEMICASSHCPIGEGIGRAKSDAQIRIPERRQVAKNASPATARPPIGEIGFHERARRRSGTKRRGLVAAHRSFQCEKYRGVKRRLFEMQTSPVVAASASARFVGGFGDAIKTDIRLSLEKAKFLSPLRNYL